MIKRRRLLLFSSLALLMGTITGSFYVHNRDAVTYDSKAQSNQIIVTEPVISGKDNLQLRTFKIITLTPSPTHILHISPPTATITSIPTVDITNLPISPTISSPIVITTPAIGGPTPPPGFYCIDDHDPDECDDDSSHLVPYGRTGGAGNCGKIIEQSHALVASLPRYSGGKGIRNSLNPAVSNACASTGPYNSPDYISTFFVIDSFNLAGLNDLSKSSSMHVSPSGLFSFFQSAPYGYVFTGYSPTLIQQFGNGQRNLIGCMIFLRMGSSYHVGIVNNLELFTTHGDGVLSILQSGTRMWVDRFPVAGWEVQNTSTNQTNTDGIAGFGCRQ